MDANNTIHDDFTVAHLIILGEMYCSPIQLDISITEEDQGKYDRNIMGVDGLHVRWMDEWTRHRAAKLSAGPKRGFKLGCILVENLGKG